MGGLTIRTLFQGRLSRPGRTPGGPAGDPPPKHSTIVDIAEYKPKKLGGLFLVSILIGLLGGLFSWLFRLLIGAIHNLAFQGEWSLHYDANLHTPASYLGWLIILVPVLGGLVVVYLIRNYAPEAKGHGVPEVMNAIYHKGGVIPGNVSIVKALASAITIGTGGSLGREGPIVQISSAFSSVLGQWLKVPPKQRNLFIACGASAGIAATFNAPLGGILFSIELLMVTVNSRTILPVAISTVIGASTGRILIGNEPAFVIPAVQAPLSETSSMLITLLAIPMGALIGLFSLLFIKGIYFAEDLFDERFANPYLRHVVGTLLLGILFYLLLVYSGHYYVQGVGYAAIQDVLWDAISSPWLLLALIVLKLLATCLTIGSGGSGGVFSPSLFLGALSGALFSKIIALLLPGLAVEPIVFVVAGMAAMVSATTSAPLTAAIIVYEMTLDYGAVLPIMAAVGVAYAVRRHFLVDDIYTLKLRRRGQLIPEGLTTDIKSHILIDKVVEACGFCQEHDKVTAKGGIVCVLKGDEVINVLDLDNSYLREELPASEIEAKEFVVIPAGITIADAIHHLKEAHTGVALVTSDGHARKSSILGAVTTRSLIRVIAHTASQLR
ncbi:MAG TPA: chloride channel protein [Sedimenticola thiotaurini]|uniref:Chloride channel protein n=1 Tax=Sedimenticola thiotaurini TaxID=1543721 RepID=A0A831W9K2_9GAMM|nr:chloride channel protein [Sedimenticola thiotaurini]